MHKQRNKPFVVIRADGGSSIGMGHIMRCISLAKAFVLYGAKIVFASNMPDGLELLANRGFDTIELHNASIEEEAEELRNYCLYSKTDLLIVDSYNVTPQYFSKLKGCAELIGYIDDLDKFLYEVDIIINGNINAKLMQYNGYSSGTLKLLGLEYNLIRDEFKDLPRRNINDKIKNILVTAGGGDVKNIAELISDYILDDYLNSDIQINLVVGSAYKKIDYIEEKYKFNKNVNVLKNVQKMSEIMLEADFAISAGGSTLYELCACGTPGAAFIYADNQEGIVKEMESLGLIKNLGWYHELNPQCIYEVLNQMESEKKFRVDIAEKGQSLVDGHGAERVVERVFQQLETIK
jgi:UDP-2,4-diacetamido-2,4,6-trideoxy-beta-L-altropyranose hydrolase